jgi:hypothetical protein
MQDITQFWWFIPLLLVLFVVSFAALWSLVLLLISAIGGWSRLAGSYRATEPFTGQRWSWQSGGLGWSRYRGVLTIGADPTGLYLDVMVLFRIAHPALLIPWSDITAEERTMFLLPVMALQFTQVPGVTLALYRGTWEKVLAARGG